MLYQIALFFHVVGALGIFVALALEWLGLLNMRRAETVEDVRQWGGVLRSVRRIGPIAMVIILISAFYMVATAWGGAGWIIVAFLALLLFPPLGAISGTRMASVGRAIATQHGALTPALREKLRHPLVWTLLLVRTAMALGIVFLMTVKPDLLGSVITMGIAIVLGLVTAMPVLNRQRAMNPAA